MNAKKLIIVLLSLTFVPLACNYEAEQADTIENDGLEVESTDVDLVEEDLYDEDEVREFVMEFASFNMLMLEVSQTAAERSSMQKLKDLANNTMKEHKNMEQELRKWAQQNNWSLPQTMDEDDVDRLDEFREVPSDDLNGEYLELIVDQHQEILDEMEDDLEEAGDNDEWGIASWIKKTMPKLKMHKNEAEKLKDMSPKAN